MTFMITNHEWGSSQTHIFSRSVDVCATKSSVLSHSLTIKVPGIKVHSADNWPIFQDNDNGEVDDAYCLLGSLSYIYCWVSVLFLWKKQNGSPLSSDQIDRLETYCWKIAYPAAKPVFLKWGYTLKSDWINGPIFILLFIWIYEYIKSG